MSKFGKITADARAAVSKFGDNAKTLGTKVGTATAGKAETVSTHISKGMSKTKTALDGATVIVADSARKGIDTAKTLARATGNGLAAGADVAKRSATTVAIAAFDQNGDGTFDQNDLKMLTQKIVRTGADVAKEMAKSDLVNKASGGALVGGVIASVVPGIGTVAGAVIGASAATYKHFTEK